MLSVELITASELLHLKEEKKFHDEIHKMVNKLPEENMPHKKPKKNTGTKTRLK